MYEAQSVYLASDGYSPMGEPHGLPALYWPALAAEKLTTQGVEAIEDSLRAAGWDPQWRFGMYRQAHYHSTTHELLVVIAGRASIQLGGTDKRARPRNNSSDESNTRLLDLYTGDVLLLPAGYAHRSIHDEEGFTMIGAYPKGAKRWDMRFPNVMGCPHDETKIKEWVNSSHRKGLLQAGSPETLGFSSDVLSSSQNGDVERHWHIQSQQRTDTT